MTSASPVLSVVIPVRNGGEHFRLTLRSLIAQDVEGLPWEVVIADDGSDHAIEEEFSGLIGEGGGIFRVVRLESNGSRSSARNAANAAARGKILLMMDGDLEFDSDLVRRHLEHHRKGTADIVMGPTCDTWRPLATRFQKWADSRSMGGQPAGPFPWRYFKTGNISVRRELVESVGGYDESMIEYGGEDTELGYRLWRSGATFHWDPGMIARHQSEIDVRMHARRMITYGRTVLSYTLRKHPEIGFLLGNQWVGPILRRPRRPSYVLMRTLTPVLLLPAAYRLILWWAEKVGFPGFLFTYVSVGGCMIGLRGRSLDLRC